MEAPDLIDRIQHGRYGDSVAEILALTKQAAALAQQHQPTEIRSQWLQPAGIHPDTWARLVALGRAKTLHRPELWSRLPANVSTLAGLARCSEKELEQALAEGLITPRLSYRALAAWRKGLAQRPIQPAPLLKLLPIAVVVAPDTDPIEELAIRFAISEAMASLSGKAELITLQGWERPQEQAIEQWQRNRLEEHRQALNQRIAPHSLSPDRLRLPFAELKEASAALDPEQWTEVYLLKHAQTALEGESKQQRYASRTRLQSMAPNHPLARTLLRDVLGLAEQGGHS